MHTFRRIATTSALLLAAVAHADEIYKWVDKDGKTHYSSNRDEAAGAATRTVKTSPGPASGPPPSAAAANAEIIQRRAPETTTTTLQAPAMPKATSYGSETNAAKCQLAQDILSGRARRFSGVPIDAYDRQVAESDVRTFCK